MNNKQILNNKNAENAITKEKEMQAIIIQWSDLRQQGKYDEAAELWANSRKKDDAHNIEMPDLIKNIHQPPFANSKYRKPFLTLVILLITFLLGGILLESTIGERFIFAWADKYRELVNHIYFVLLPISAIISFFSFRKDPYIRKKYPTKVVRWIFIFPFFTCLLPCIPLVAPLGWAAFSGWMIGSESQNMQARIVSVAPKNYSRKRHCTQRAELEFRSNSAELCIDGLFIGGTPKPNEKVLIAGQVSWFGIYIQQIRTQSK